MQSSSSSPACPSWFQQAQETLVDSGLCDGLALLMHSPEVRDLSASAIPVASCGRLSNEYHLKGLCCLRRTFFVDPPIIELTSEKRPEPMPNNDEIHDEEEEDGLIDEERGKREEKAEPSTLRPKATPSISGPEEGGLTLGNNERLTIISSSFLRIMAISKHRQTYLLVESLPFGFLAATLSGRANSRTAALKASNALANLCDELRK